MLTLLFDGIAYGMLLFVLAVGLAVTMGLMNFINLAHGAFAMVGGYITVLLMQRLDVPFLVCLPIAFAGAALLLGIADVAGKYFIPKMGAFTVYLLIILILMWRPQGLFTRKGGK